MPNMWIDVNTAVTVPVNVLPLLDDTDFKTIKEAVAYDAAGMDLNWNFVTSAGVVSQTNVAPTTGGVYDWSHINNGMYKIEIPASGGVSINNNVEGYGWFSGICTGVLPWCGPRIGFRAAGINDKLCDWLYSPARGLAGTALPNANADAAWGLPTSDAGGLDLDTKLANTNEVTAARMAALTDWIDTGRLDVILDAIKAKTDTLGSAAITVTSPVSSTSDITIQQYDDYHNTEGRSLDWSNSDGDWGPDDITDATVEFLIRDARETIKLEVAGSVVTPTGTQVVRVVLANTDTADLTTTARYTYQLRLILDSSERQETIATGVVAVTNSGFTS